MNPLFAPLPPRTKPRSRPLFWIEFVLVSIMSVWLAILGPALNAAHPGQIPHYKIIIAPFLPFLLWIFIRYFLFGSTAEKMPVWLQWALLVGMAAYGILG